MLRTILIAISAWTLLLGAADAQRRPESAPGASVTRGLVTFYGREFAGSITASGEPFDPEALTMAHNTLAFGTRVRVTNLRNSRSVEVRVNDRGPFGEKRVADLSLAAARALGMVRRGIIEAKLEVLGQER